MQLPDPLSGQLELLVGCFLRLFDECVNDHDALPEQEAVKGTADAGTTARPEFEQAFAEGARVRQPKAWPVLRQELDQTRIVGDNVDWPGLDLCQNARMEVLDPVRHASC